MVDLGSQQIEILGRSRLKAALIEAGLEVATPERDNGIDLIMYRWSPEGGEFVARPVQMKAATEFTFSVDRKYERIPALVIAYVMNARGGEHAIYAMTYPEAADIAATLGWTRTKSWEDGGYTRTCGSKKLIEALEPYRMAPGDWGRFFGSQQSGSAHRPTPPVVSRSDG
jgi:hypothetical protein